VRVLGERGAPGVQDREDTDAGAEVFGIGRDGEHGLGRSLEQDAVDCGLVLVGYIGDLSRQREHDVEVRHRQELGLALGQPLARRRTLALRTVPIATGVVCDLRVTALLVLAACNMAAERCRAAVLDRRHHLELLKADMAGIGLTPCRSMAAEDIYCLLCQSLFGRYSRSNMIPSWSEWIERAGEVPSGRPPWASLRFSSARRPDHRADPGKRAKRRENH